MSAPVESMGGPSQAGRAGEAEVVEILQQIGLAPVRRVIHWQ